MRTAGTGARRQRHISGLHQTMFEDAHLAPLRRLFIDALEAVTKANLKRGHDGASS
jgi:hypothetical protein